METGSPQTPEEATQRQTGATDIEEVTMEEREESRYMDRSYLQANKQGGRGSRHEPPLVPRSLASEYDPGEGKKLERMEEEEAPQAEGGVRAMEYGEGGFNSHHDDAGH
jgi:hypothetical protein